MVENFDGITRIDLYFTDVRFCVNLGGKFLLHYLTNKLTINTLVN